MKNHPQGKTQVKRLSKKNFLPKLVQMFFALFLFLGILNIFSSCAHQFSISKTPDVAKNSHEKDQESVEDNENAVANEAAEKMEKETWRMAEDKLDALIEAAKETGPHAVTYLANDLFLKADAASRMGDTKSSLFLYQQLLKIEKQDLFIQKKLGVELIKSGQFTEAKDLFMQIIKASPEDENALFILAGVYIALDESPKANQLYQKILVINPKNSEACLFLAKSYFEKEDIKNAHQKLNDCQKKNPEDGTYAYYRGKFYLEKSKYENALKAFQESLKLNPELFQAALAIGLIYEEQEKTKSAINVYRSYLNRDLQNKFILSRLVNLLFSESRYEEVIPYAEVLSSIDPMDLNLKVKLGILYADTKQFSKAILVFQDIESQVPDSDKIIYYLGAIFQEMKEYQKSIDYFSKIPNDSTLFVDSNMQIAEMFKDLTLSQKENDDFKNQFLEFTDKNSEHPDLAVYMNIMRANYYESHNQIEKAIASMENIKGKKGYSENQDYYLAVLFEKKGDHQKSISIMEQIIQENPRHAHALNFIGYSWLERGNNLDLAHQYIKKAVELSPEDGFIRDSLGWYYYTVGNYEKALEHVQKAKELVENDVVIAKHLGLIYQKLKNFQLAKKYLNEAFQNASQTQEKEELLVLLKALDADRLPASGDSSNSRDSRDSRD
jgi:tetratricopeptide (TPR) repeat protein